jgi:hypothetical protein
MSTPFYNEKERNALLELHNQGYSLFPLKAGPITTDESYKRSKSPDMSGKQSWQTKPNDPDKTPFKGTIDALDKWLMEDRKLGFEVPEGLFFVDVDNLDAMPEYLDEYTGIPSKNGKHIPFVGNTYPPRKLGYGETLHHGHYACIHSPIDLYRALHEATSPPAELMARPIKKGPGLQVNTTTATLGTTTRNISLNQMSGHLAGLDPDARLAAMRGINSAFTKGPMADSRVVAMWKQTDKFAAADGVKIDPTAFAEPDLIDSTALCTMNLPEFDYIAPGVALGQSMLISADAGVGKSSYMIDLIRRSLERRPDVTHLVINCEMAPRTLANRMGPGLNGLTYWNYIGQVNTFLEHPIVQQYDCIWLDSVTLAYENSKYEENHAAWWAPINRWVVEQTQNNKFVGVLHHANRHGHTRGSTASGQVVDSCIRLIDLCEDYDQKDVEVKIDKNRQDTELDYGSIRQSPMALDIKPEQFTVSQYCPT